MPASLPNKILSVFMPVTESVLSILPEFLPEEWKSGLKTMLGTNYAFVWMSFFAILSIGHMWYLNKTNDIVNSHNYSKMKGNRNEAIQNASGGAVVNKTDIEGDDNKVQQN